MKPIVQVIIMVLFTVLLSYVVATFVIDLSEQVGVNDNEDYSELDAYKDVNICFTNGAHQISFKEDSNISRVDVLHTDNSTVYKTIETPDKITEMNRSGDYTIKVVTDDGVEYRMVRIVF